MTLILRLFVMFLMALTPAVASPGEILLTLTGMGAPIQIDRDRLESMPQTTFSTTTIWTEGEQTFTGVPLNVFFAEMGVSEGRVKAMAVNDYAIEIPVSDGVDGGPIIAYELNGQPMSVRNKGPLWIVYPYDSHPEYRSEVIYARSIWQLDRIEVLR